MIAVVHNKIGVGGGSSVNSSVGFEKIVLVLLTVYW